MPESCCSSCSPSLFFAARWLKVVASRRSDADGSAEARAPRIVQLAVGLVTIFLDTLGIGSFATTTTAYSLAATRRDRAFPEPCVGRAPHRRDRRSSTSPSSGRIDLFSLMMARAVAGSVARRGDRLAVPPARDPARRRSRAPRSPPIFMRWVNSGWIPAGGDGYRTRPAPPRPRRDHQLRPRRAPDRWGSETTGPASCS